MERNDYSRGMSGRKHDSTHGGRRPHADALFGSTAAHAGGGVHTPLFDLGTLPHARTIRQHCQGILARIYRGKEGRVIELQNVPGYEESVRECGQPVERTCIYEVGRRAFDERQIALGKREAEVVLVIRRPNGCYLLHTKGFYPSGTYRLLTGGIKSGEPLLKAVRRELREETGLGGQVERFLAVQHHAFRMAGRSVPFTSYVFMVAGEAGTPAPNDEGENITAFREVALNELIATAEQLEALLVDWADWGRFRASAHRLVVELLTAEGGA